MGLDLAAVEKIVLPMVSPLFLELWTSTLLPAIKQAATTGNPALQIIETAGVEFLDVVVKAELAKLSQF